MNLLVFIQINIHSIVDLLYDSSIKTDFSVNSLVHDRMVLCHVFIISTTNSFMKNYSVFAEVFHF